MDMNGHSLYLARSVDVQKRFKYGPVGVLVTQVWATPRKHTWLFKRQDGYFRKSTMPGSFHQQLFGPVGWFHWVWKLEVRHGLGKPTEWLDCWWFSGNGESMVVSCWNLDSFSVSFAASLSHARCQSGHRHRGNLFLWKATMQTTLYEANITCVQDPSMIRRMHAAMRSLTGAWCAEKEALGDSSLGHWAGIRQTLGVWPSKTGDKSLEKCNKII
jgi:hypothetical protein